MSRIMVVAVVLGRYARLAESVFSTVHTTGGLVRCEWQSLQVVLQSTGIGQSMYAREVLVPSASVQDILL